MKIHGYCTVCHRIKRVTVRVPPVRGVAMGVCDDCRDRPRREAEARRRGRR